MKKPKNAPAQYKYSKYYRSYSQPKYNTAAAVKNPTNNKHKLKPYVIALLFVIVISFGYVKLRHHTPVDKVVSSIENKVSSKKTTQQPTSDAASQQALNTVNTAVNAVISANSGITFEVAVNDLNNGTQLDFGSTSVPMTAASVSKILTATDFLQEVENGSQTMGETLDDGNSASSDLQSLIVVSSDSAWDALDDALTGSQLQNYSNNLGYSSFNYENNTLSARDTANIFTALYQGKLLNSSDTKLLLSYLEQANYRTYILPAIPSYDTVYHKIGLYNDNVNDATIITNGKQTISLVIFTNGNGTYNWPNRAILMQDITKPILAYYQLN